MTRAHPDDHLFPDGIEVVFDMDEAPARADDAPTGVALRKPRSTWDEFDVAGLVAAGAPDEPPAAYVTRVDGAKLLYRGKVHSIAGEPESGKGWFAVAACAEVLRTTDEHVLYVDFEDSPVSIVRRMLDVGADPVDVSQRFHVIAPEEQLPEKGEARVHLMEALVAPLRIKSRYALVILDGVTQAIANQQGDSNDNDAVAAWFRDLPRMFTKKLVDHGQVPAVLMVDHVTKSKDRGRFAIGAGTKLAAIDGVQFLAEVKIPFSRSAEGLVRIVVSKDRPGHVRACAAGSAHAQALVDMRIVPDGEGGVAVVLDTPDIETKSDGTVKTTALQKQVVRYLRKARSARRLADIQAAITGRNATILAAINDLEDEGVIHKIREGRTILYYLPDDTAGGRTFEVED